MTLFDELPPELICQILSYLPLQDLAALRRTSRPWERFFIENESLVYRRAAVQHKFACSFHATLEEVLNEKESGYLGGVADWRTLCQRRFLLESNWARDGYRSLTWVAKDHPDVHRIKVDEDIGMVMTTHADGGLIVRDLDTGDVLWGLPRTYVRSYAHCEYGNGFLIFDRLGQAKEIWKLASQYENSPLPPDELQAEISFTINKYIPTTKGSFKPWALLTMPEFSRAFRFVYPTLLVAGLDKAYLYDVESGQLQQTVDDTQVPRDGVILGDINYAELSSSHVLLCGRRQLRLFERGSGALQYVLPPRLDDLVSVRVAVHEQGISSPSSERALVVPATLHRLEAPKPTSDSEYIAVHTSPDGQTLAALTNDSRLVVIKDLARVIKREVPLQDAAVEIHLACPEHGIPSAYGSGVYLAFEHGRVAVVTIFGVFVVTLDSSEHGLLDPWLEAHRQPQDAGAALRGSAFPYLHLCRVWPFDSKALFGHVSCLQMTRTRLALTWHPNVEPLTGDEEGEASDDSHMSDAAGTGPGPVEVLQLDLTLSDEDEDIDEDGLILGVDNEGPEIDVDDGDDEDDGFVMNGGTGLAWGDDPGDLYLKAVACVNFAPTSTI